MFKIKKIVPKCFFTVTHISYNNNKKSTVTKQVGSIHSRLHVCEASNPFSPTNRAGTNNARTRHKIFHKNRNNTTTVICHWLRNY